MSFRKPEWPGMISTRAVLGMATLGPIGMKLPAPGTWGSIAGLAYFTVCFYPLGPVENLVASAVMTYFAAAICGEAEIRMGRTDPGEVILDEVIAMPLCFVGWQWLVGPLPGWAVFLAGLALFRFFDILKPLGIARLQKLPGGWGVTIDDTAAALATCLTLHLAHGIWLLTHR